MVMDLFFQRGHGFVPSIPHRHRLAAFEMDVYPSCLRNCSQDCGDVKRRWQDLRRASCRMTMTSFFLMKLAAGNNVFFFRSLLDIPTGNSVRRVLGYLGISQSSRVASSLRNRELPSWRGARKQCHVLYSTIQVSTWYYSRVEPGS